MTTEQFIEKYNGHFISGEADRFQLFSDLLEPIRQMEEKVMEWDSLQRSMESARKTLRSPVSAAMIKTVTGVFLFAIPFLIVFYLVGNFCHLPGGETLYSAYDQWVSTQPILTAFYDWVPTQHDSIVVMLLVAALMMAYTFVFVPIVTVLLPLSLAVSVIATIFSVLNAAKTVRWGKKNGPVIGNDVQKMLERLAPFTYHVPDDYCNSIALEHFCRSYRNGRASTLKEAIDVLESDIHRSKMEMAQQEVLAAQQKTLTELQQQSLKLAEMQRSLRKIKRKTDWL